MKTTIFIERNDEEIEVEVTGDCYAEVKERWYLDNGDPGYPGEAAHCELTAAINVATGEEIELTRGEEEIAEDELMQLMGDEDGRY